MYDFSQHTYNGEAVAYASLPNYLLDLIDADQNLTPTAKLIYFRLLRYAAYRKQTSFIITIAWLSERLQLNRKTVAAGLQLLKVHGYLTDEGIVIPAPSTTSTGARQAPFPLGQKQTKVTLAAIHANPEPETKAVTTTNTAIDASVIQNILSAVGSTRKVKSTALVNNADNQHPMSKLYPFNVQKTDIPY